MLCCIALRGVSLGNVHARLRCSSRLPTSCRRRSALCARAMQTVTLQPEELTPDAFAPFGQVIDATIDGKPFDKDDAQLNLTKGKPRLYIMSLPAHGLGFDQITYHSDVTQCLCGISQRAWFLAVAAPTHAVEKYPKVNDLHAFKIPPGVFVKLHEGTWHAGPHFAGDQACNFANLELADTNVVDHHTHKYQANDLRFEIAPV